MDVDYEARRESPLPLLGFTRRVLRHVSIAGVLVVGALAIGMLGYSTIAGLSLVDSFENASMILAGMGPVDRMDGTGAKLFAGCYALFSGFVFLASAGVVLSPFIHRVLHKFHQTDDEPTGP